MNELAHALAQAATALEARDDNAAAEALEAAERACAVARSRGLRLDGAELKSLRELHRRGEAAAQRALEELAQALDAAGCARRAVSAYGR